MIINHNLGAVNANRLLSKNNMNTNKAMEKLSSGLKINKAGDNAAGLAISEKMRGQIRGLNQASANAQDAISLLETIDGALGETNSLVQRIRELSVQSANDTSTDVDRKSVQDEINQLKQEVDRIGSTTEFNGIKLLESGVSDSEACANIVKGLKEGWLEMAEKKVLDEYGLVGTGINLKITLVDGSPYGELAHVSGNTSELELTIDISDFEPGTGDDGTNILGKLYNDRIIAHEITHAVMDSALGVKMNILPTWFVEGTAEFIAGADERLKNIISDASNTGIDVTKSADLVNRASALLAGAAWVGDDMDYSAGYVITKYMSSELNNANDMGDLMLAIRLDGSVGGIDALDNALSANGSINSINSVVNLKIKFDAATNASDFISGLQLDWGSNETDVGAIGGSSTGGSALSAESVIDESLATDKTDGQPMQNFNVIFPESTVSSQLSFMIGANSGQTMVIDLQDMRSGAVGISSIDVSDSTKASDAIQSCDNAIKTVSSFRSRIGAYSNRLEHTINNLSTTSENLTLSESRIRDVDMAKEMSNFSKNNILSQAAQAMLLQANQQPQQVLALLR